MRSVPYLLTPNQRHERVQPCQELLARYSAEGNDFLFRIITDDEFFLNYYNPQSKRSPKEWKRADSQLPTKFKQEKLAGKVAKFYILFFFFLRS